MKVIYFIFILFFNIQISSNNNINQIYDNKLENQSPNNLKTKNFSMSVYQFSIQNKHFGNDSRLIRSGPIVEVKANFLNYYDELFEHNQSSIKNTDNINQEWINLNKDQKFSFATIQKPYWYKFGMYKKFMKLINSNLPNFLVYYIFQPISLQLITKLALISDVRQGKIGNCYLLSALASLSQHRQQIITQMIEEISSDNNDYQMQFLSSLIIKVTTKIFPIILKPFQIFEKEKQDFINVVVNQISQSVIIVSYLYSITSIDSVRVGYKTAWKVLGYPFNVTIDNYFPNQISGENNIYVPGEIYVGEQIIDDKMLSESASIKQHSYYCLLFLLPLVLSQVKIVVYLSSIFRDNATKFIQKILIISVLDTITLFLFSPVLYKYYMELRQFKQKIKNEQSIIFSHPQPTGYWPIVLEKSQAKIHGDQNRIVAGQISQVFKDILQSPVQIQQTIYLNRNNQWISNQNLYISKTKPIKKDQTINQNDMFNLLRKFAKKGYPMGLDSNEQNELSVSIVEKHAQALLEVDKIEQMRGEEKSEERKVVKIFNPWNRNNQDGVMAGYVDQSDAEKQRLKLQPQNKNDQDNEDQGETLMESGVFVCTFEEQAANFRQTQVAAVETGQALAWLRVDIEGQEVPGDRSYTVQWKALTEGRWQAQIEWANVRLLKGFSRDNCHPDGMQITGTLQHTASGALTHIREYTRDQQRANVSGEAGDYEATIHIPSNDKFQRIYQGRGSYSNRYVPIKAFVFNIYGPKDIITDMNQHQIK